MHTQIPAPQAALAAAPVFNFMDYEDVHTGTLRIKNPADGSPTPMVVTLAGPEHPDRKRRLFARQRRLRAVIAKTNKMPVNDPQDDEVEALDELVANVLGWEGFPMPYSPQAAREVLGDSKRRWLRDQVAAGLEERELFIRSSAQS